MSTTTTATATTFKTKINSVSNGCSLAALKEHITTCLQRWRQKHSTNASERHTPAEGEHQQHTHSQHKQRPQEEKCYCHFQHKSNRCCFVKHKEFTFLQRTTLYINRKFHKLISTHQRHVVNSRNSATVNDCKGPRQYGRKVEIVAKLLSTTLIAKAKTNSSSTATEDFGQQTDDHHIYRCFEEQIQLVQSSTTSSTSDYYGDNAMTITDLTFLEIREEYPDLNSEIRSILTARAQDGASISEIRDDYRKLTGLPFPIYEDVTEFLLTIPYVMAYCSEKGTRIFNIMPMEKTKHIHDMVMHQKPQPEPQQRSSTGNHCYYRERQRNSNYQPQNWRHNTSRRLQQNMVNIYAEPVNIEQQEQLIPSTDSNVSRDGSEGFFENNCYYQDNCNYLFNRICNQQQPPLTTQLMENPPMEQTPSAVKPAPLPPATNAGTSSALNNFNTDIPCYKNNVNHLNNLFHIQPQQEQYQQYHQSVNNVAIIDNRRSSHNPFKTGMPRSSRSSSPTTKSWYTNDSVYTDSDYEAHLLDFLLLGDDFFLYMARMELRCKFKKNQRVLQSGLCVSGQTIGGAIKRIRALSDSRRSVIINIGSVDLMQGRQLIQIEHDFRELLLTMLKKGIKPILTTLAPLANYSHNCDLKRLLERFNEFIKREGQYRNLVVIDIWKCLVNEKGHVFFDCYQNEPRNVTGATESYLFWNKIGRQRVLQLIESKLEY
ncbi:maternal effect protein oskar [Lucilia cuprina]|uniref:maternal effect protein oskar n=1 Tax=Lucilia cuprina TaxID=7375 RepID=UPI001F0560DD|nr:maternal effect protein oskar [Lucilia cuprina]